MIKLHYLNNSRAQRILFMLEELGIPYEIDVHLREHGLAPQSLKDIHPLGKSPVITDGDRVIAESGVIIEYLAEKYGKGSMTPAGDFDSQDMLNYKYWLHYAEGSLASALIMQLVFSRVKSDEESFKQIMAGYVGPNVHNQLSFVDNFLATHDWFAGDSISAADVQMTFPLEGAIKQKGAADIYPNIKTYIDKIHARPAYQRALEAGEPYAFADKN